MKSPMAGISSRFLTPTRFWQSPRRILRGLRELTQTASRVHWDDEVHARQMFGEPALPSVTGLGLEPVDQIDPLYNRPRKPLRTIARWVLPVPVPPTNN